MAKTKTKTQLKGKQSFADHFKMALTAKNYIIIGTGILSIIIGYIFMSANSVDGFLPTVIAPILLVLGYCVIVPFGILYKDKSVAEENDINEKKVKVNKVNIKTAENVKAT
jgi:hypothetical protein